MMSQALSKFHMPALTCVGLLLFLGVFVGACIWVYRRGSTEFYQKLSQLPLEGDLKNGK